MLSLSRSAHQNHETGTIEPQRAKVSDFIILQVIALRSQPGLQSFPVRTREPCSPM